jgi:uncharacterized membrane protein (DUF4010 family)
MFARVLFQIALVNIELVSAVWVPLSMAGVAGLLYAIYLYVRRTAGTRQVQFKNPFDLRAALRFGLLYAFILLLSRSAQLYFGEPGVLLSSFLAGFSDSNAITLSLSELSKSGGLSLNVAAEGIVIATMTNTLFKGGIVLTSAAPGLRKAVWPGLVLVVAVGVAAVYLL